MKNEREQKLVDLCFNLVLTITSTFTELSHKKKAAWVIKQLNQNGFSTTPCAGSWGELPYEPEEKPAIEVSDQCHEAIKDLTGWSYCSYCGKKL